MTVVRSMCDAGCGPDDDDNSGSSKSKGCNSNTAMHNKDSRHAVAGDATSSTAALPDDVGAVLQLLLLRVSRALLHHPRRDALASGTRRQLYEALAQLFAQWAARAQRARSRSVSAAELRCVLHVCLTRLAHCAAVTTLLDECAAATAVRDVVDGDVSEDVSTCTAQERRRRQQAAYGERVCPVVQRLLQCAPRIATVDVRRALRALSCSNDEDVARQQQQQPSSLLLLSSLSRPLPPPQQEQQQERHAQHAASSSDDDDVLDEVVRICHAHARQHATMTAAAAANTRDDAVCVVLLAAVVSAMRPALHMYDLLEEVAVVLATTTVTTTTATTATTTPASHNTALRVWLLVSCCVVWSAAMLQAPPQQQQHRQQQQQHHVVGVSSSSSAAVYALHEFASALVMHTTQALHGKGVGSSDDEKEQFLLLVRDTLASCPALRVCAVDAAYDGWPTAARDAEGHARMERQLLLDTLQLRRQCYYLTDKAFMLDCWHRSYSRGCCCSRRRGSTAACVTRASPDDCRRSTSSNSKDDDNDDNDDELCELLAQARRIVATAVAQLSTSATVESHHTHNTNDEDDDEDTSYVNMITAALQTLHTALSPAYSDAQHSSHAVYCDAAARFARWDDAMQTLLCALELPVSEQTTATTTRTTAAARRARHVVHTLLDALALHLYMRGLHYYQSRAMTAATRTAETATRAQKGAATAAAASDNKRADGTLHSTTNKSNKDAAPSNGARCSWSVAATLPYSVYALLALDDACAP